MNSRNPMVQVLGISVVCGLALMNGSCRKEKPEGLMETGPPSVVAPELKSNGLGMLPGAVYKTQAGSAIHWQPWTKETFDRAEDAQRLLFGVIAMPQQPGVLPVLDALAADKALASRINSEYVPVLIDGDAAREMGLLTADLCAEIRRNLQLPLFVWMTYEGNPVAWIPVPESDVESVGEVFRQSDMMVSQMWRDDREYVLDNSASDNANRRERLANRKIERTMSRQPAVDVVRSLRQLASLYDRFSRSFDETGGLFPSSAIELMSKAARHPGLPKEVRDRCVATVTELMVDLLPSPMFDPLEGGVFSSRSGKTWMLPSYHRDCAGQARVAMALFQAYQVTGDERALERALGLLEYAGKSFGTKGGLFAVGLSSPTDTKDWMWSMEEVQQLLSEEDAAWWIRATGIKGLGNLPSESDPRRLYFRSNSIGLFQTVEEIAEAESLPLEDFRPRFDAVKKKLLAARTGRTGPPLRDETAHAGATLRMVSAYAAAYCATGEEAYRTKAVELLVRARAAFSAGPKLRIFVEESPASIGAGRAFLYGLALQAVLDVAAITMDEQWLLWSEDLATTAAELFTGNGFLKECPDEAKLVDVPVTDLAMLFDDSTAGLISSAESRLALVGRPLVASFSELATPLPVYALDRPIIHTDLLVAAIARHYPVLVLLGEGISPGLQTAVSRLDMRMVQRRPARPDEAVPAGAVKILLPEERSVIANDAASLMQAALPLPGN